MLQQTGGGGGPWSGGVRLRATLGSFPPRFGARGGTAEPRASRRPGGRTQASRKARAMTFETKATRSVRQPDAAPAHPRASGLFDPRREYDACGVGFIADLKATKSHQLVQDALAILENLEHRGAVGADPIAGDGAGILIQIPDE